MAIHDRHSIRGALEADIYGTQAADASVPKYKLGQGELRPDVAHALVRDELFLDGNARQNLSTFCQTWLDTEVHDLMDLSIDKNMIDKDEYPATAEIENRCVNILADLWHSPAAANTIGCSTTGSSEACMLGGLALKWKWRQRMEAAGKPTGKPNLITGPVQVCWHKFARYFDVELREIPLEKGRLGMTPEEVLKRVDENTIGVMPTFGVTFTCQYEPVAEIAAALDKLQADTGLDIPIHVDAASGGFIAPFIEPGLEWDFRIPRVKSINASGHKYGLAPLGVGWVVWRDKAELPEELIFNVNYLGGNMPTFALNFSRPQARPVRAILRRRQSQGTSRDLLRDQGRCPTGIFAVRPVGSAACPRLAGGGLYHAAEHRGCRRDARPGAPRLQPGYGRHAAGGHEARHRVPPKAPAQLAADRRRGNDVHA